MSSNDFVIYALQVAVMLAMALMSGQMLLGARLAGMPLNRDTWAIAFGLNARGATGIILAGDAENFRMLRLEALRSHPEVFSADYAFNEAQPTSYWIDRLKSLGTLDAQDVQVAQRGQGMIYFAESPAGLEGMGGVRLGDEPQAIQVDGRMYAELLMVCFLD